MTIWREYQELGVRVWGVASNEPIHVLENFRDQLGITFPILNDEDGSVFAQYSMTMGLPTAAYPQDWIVGVDGSIAYINNHYEPAIMVSVLESELEAALGN
jgi:peroxiredoxin